MKQYSNGLEAIPFFLTACQLQATEIILSFVMNGSVTSQPPSSQNNTVK